MLEHNLGALELELTSEKLRHLDDASRFWGERHGKITDPFGHRWNLAQRLREVPHDEIVAAAAQAFGS